MSAEEVGVVGADDNGVDDNGGDVQMHESSEAMQQRQLYTTISMREGNATSTHPNENARTWRGERT